MRVPSNNTIDMLSKITLVIGSITLVIFVQYVFIKNHVESKKEKKEV